jgi:hypothetical protein
MRTIDSALRTGVLRVPAEPGLAIAALLVLVSGCSWAMTSGSRRYTNGYVECSTSSAAPGLDATIAVTATLVGVLGMFGSNQGRPDDDDERTVGIVSLGAAGIFAASAISGKQRVNECRIARAAQPPMPPPPPPPPPQEPQEPMWIEPDGTPIHVDVHVHVNE